MTALNKNFKSKLQNPSPKSTRPGWFADPIHFGDYPKAGANASSRFEGVGFRVWGVGFVGVRA